MDIQEIQRARQLVDLEILRHERESELRTMELERLRLMANRLSERLEHGLVRIAPSHGVFELSRESRDVDDLRALGAVEFINALDFAWYRICQEVRVPPPVTILVSGVFRENRFLVRIVVSGPADSLIRTWTCDTPIDQLIADTREMVHWQVTSARSPKG